MIYCGTKGFEKRDGGVRTVGGLLDKYIKDYAIPNKASNTIRTDISMDKEIEDFFGEGVSIRL